VFGFGGPVRRARDGSYTIKLGEHERDVLRSLPGQMRELLATPDDPALGRLYPPAYLGDDDQDKNEEYRRLMQGDLTEGRLRALAVLEETAGADRVDEEQLLAWMGAINDVRLVLGTRLDVTEDLYEEDVADDDPRAPALHLYGYLGYLLDSIVKALSGAL
jgi:hypothetical protein